MQKDSQSYQPVVLVTGCSSGVGLSLIRKLWNSHYRVIATARESSLEEILKAPFTETSRFIIRPLDITISKQRRAIVAEAESLWGGVDVLVNNAGIAYRAVAEHMSDADDVMQMAVNYFGPIALTKLVLPGMRERRRGHIINISSVGGMMAMPTMGGYSASKFALEGASESLWYELRPWNIRVSLVQPGFIHSSSFQHVLIPAKGQEAIAAHGSYSEMYESMGAFISKLMNRAVATPESVAEKILRVMEDLDPPLRVPATSDAIFFSLLRRWLPRSVYHRLLYWNLPNINSWGKK